MKVEFTETARSKAIEFLSSEDPPAQALRLKVVKTKCMGGRGVLYDLGPAAGEADGDVVAGDGEPRVLVDAESLPFLADVRIDYVVRLPREGFALVNSRAAGKCPCGHHDIIP